MIVLMVKKYQMIFKKLKLKIIENKLKPGLGIILVGNRKDLKHVRMKKACKKIGIINYDVHLDENI